MEVGGGGEGLVKCEGKGRNFPELPPPSPPDHFSFPFAPLFSSLLRLSLAAMWFGRLDLEEFLKYSISVSLEHLLMGFKCVLKTFANPKKASGKLVYYMDFISTMFLHITLSERFEIHFTPKWEGVTWRKTGSESKWAGYLYKVIREAEKAQSRCKE